MMIEQCIAHTKGVSGLTNALFTQPLHRALGRATVAEKRQLLAILDKMSRSEDEDIHDTSVFLKREIRKTL
jgi:hypothetical protein